jgi:transposase
MWTNESRARYDRSQLRYPNDLTDEEWTLVAPLIPPGKSGGGKRRVIMREIVNGLMYVLSPAASGARSPKDLPPKSSVHDYFDLWTYDGTLDRMPTCFMSSCEPTVVRQR